MERLNNQIFSYLSQRGYFAIAMLSLVSSGCEPATERRAIGGWVTVDREKIERGSVTFLPDQGHRGPAASTAITNGRYQFTSQNGPTAGPHRVIIGVETNPMAPGIDTLAASSPESSSIAKQGPDAPPMQTTARMEPLQTEPRQTKWESKVQVPNADDSNEQNVDFSFEREPKVDEIDPNGPLAR